VSGEGSASLGRKLNYANGATDMKTDKNQSLDILGPLKFLLTCSELDVDNFELNTLGNLANLRSQAADVMENMLREISRLDLVRSIRASSPEQIKEALERPSDAIADAKLKIKNTGRSVDELVPLLPLVSAAVKANHVAASIRYQERNVEEGKCCDCPEPLARNSVLYCETHLAAYRDRARVRAKKLNKPPHGRAPGTLAALAEKAKSEINF
jgi:hypothetical protein